MDNITSFIKTKQIDSYQKLQLLLLFHRYPHMLGTAQTYARKLYIGEPELMKNIIDDLEDKDILSQFGEYYGLPVESPITEMLNDLAKAFENPVTRQRLLDHIYALDQHIR